MQNPVDVGTSYTSSDNQFTVPDDGYITAYSWQSEVKEVFINDVSIMEVAPKNKQLVFVKKGMRIYSPAATCTNLYYYQLI